MYLARHRIRDARTLNTPPARADNLDERFVGRPVEQARASGLRLTGEAGLPQRPTKLVVESAVEGEITDHLGYDKHDPSGRMAATPAMARGRACLT